jgi:hypothetical protein
MLGELKAMLIIADVLDDTRRGLVDTYLAGL